MKLLIIFCCGFVLFESIYVVMQGVQAYIEHDFSMYVFSVISLMCGILFVKILDILDNEEE